MPLKRTWSEHNSSYSGYSVSASRPTIRASTKTRMKSRHAAALALVGWYLMVPPMADQALTDLAQPRLIEGAAPLSLWEIRRAYDTAEECEKAEWEIRRPAIAAISKKFLANEKSLKDGSTTERIRSIDIAQDTVAKCIATDDPRLIGR